MSGHWGTRGVREALAVLVLLGCTSGGEGAAPADGQAFSPSGFLGDYAELRAGSEGRVRLGYIDSTVDFSGYTHVIVEPVVVWKSSEARFAGVPQTRREMLASELETALRQAFAREFLVGEAKPGPNTLRVRTGLTAAIAAAESSDPELLQYVEVELEILDAATNERLAAAVDSKGSRDSSAQPGQQSVEAGEAFRDWAERASIRVEALRNLDRKYGQPESP
jgi:hypothetical protein